MICIEILRAAFVCGERAFLSLILFSPLSLSLPLSFPLPPHTHIALKHDLSRNLYKRAETVIWRTFVFLASLDFVLFSFGDRTYYLGKRPYLAHTLVEVNFTSDPISGCITRLANQRSWFRKGHFCQSI